MGAKQATCRNLKLVKIDRDNNLLLIKGSVPGPSGGFIEVSASHAAEAKSRGKT